MATVLLVLTGRAGRRDQSSPPRGELHQQRHCSPHPPGEMSGYSHWVQPLLLALDSGHRGEGLSRPALPPTPECHWVHACWKVKNPETGKSTTAAHCHPLLDTIMSRPPSRPQTEPKPQLLRKSLLHPQCDSGARQRYVHAHPLELPAPRSSLASASCPELTTHLGLSLVLLLSLIFSSSASKTSSFFLDSESLGPLSLSFPSLGGGHDTLSLPWARLPVSGGSTVGRGVPRSSIILRSSGDPGSWAVDTRSWGWPAPAGSMSTSSASRAERAPLAAFRTRARVPDSGLISELDFWTSARAKAGYRSCDPGNSR